MGKNIKDHTYYIYNYFVELELELELELESEELLVLSKVSGATSMILLTEGLYKIAFFALENIKLHAKVRARNQ